VVEDPRRRSRDPDVAIGPAATSAGRPVQHPDPVPSTAPHHARLGRRV